MSWFVPVAKDRANLGYVNAAFTFCVNMYTGSFYSAYNTKLPISVQGKPVLRSEVSKRHILFVVGFDADCNKLILTDCNTIQKVSVHTFDEIVATKSYEIQYIRPIFVQDKLLVNQVVSAKSCEVQQITPEFSQYRVVISDVGIEAVMRFRDNVLLYYRRLPDNCVQQIMEKLRAVHDRMTALHITSVQSQMKQYTNACKETNILETFPIEVYDYRGLYEAIFKFLIETRTWGLSVGYDLQFYDSEIDVVVDMAIASHRITGGLFEFNPLFQTNKDIPVLIRHIRNAEPHAPVTYIYEEEPAQEPWNAISVWGYFEEIIFAPLYVKENMSFRYLQCLELDLSSIIIKSNKFYIKLEDLPYLKTVKLPQYQLECEVLWVVVMGSTDFPEVYTADGKPVKMEWGERRDEEANKYHVGTLNEW